MVAFESRSSVPRAGESRRLPPGAPNSEAWRDTSGLAALFLAWPFLVPLASFDAPAAAGGNRGFVVAGWRRSITPRAPGASGSTASAGGAGTARRCCEQCEQTSGRLDHPLHRRPGGRQLSEIPRRQSLCCRAGSHASRFTRPPVPHLREVQYGDQAACRLAPLLTVHDFSNRTPLAPRRTDRHLVKAVPLTNQIRPPAERTLHVRIDRVVLHQSPAYLLLWKRALCFCSGALRASRIICLRDRSTNFLGGL